MFIWLNTMPIESTRNGMSGRDHAHAARDATAVGGRSSGGAMSDQHAACRAAAAEFQMTQAPRSPGPRG